jgi:hypothetical protein
MPYMDGGNLEAQQWLEYDERRKQAISTVQDFAAGAAGTQSTLERCTLPSEVEHGTAATPAAASLAEGLEHSSQSASSLLASRSPLSSANSQ